MDKLVRRVTVVHHAGDNPEGIVVYENPDQRRDDEDDRRTSPLLRPIERVVRRLLKAKAILDQDAYQRYLNSGRRRRDGWLRDAPGNMIKSYRKAYNEARKAVPFGLLPKA
jgi:Family of unknown function (DUF6312)